MGNRVRLAVFLTVSTVCLAGAGGCTGARTILRGQSPDEPSSETAVQANSVGNPRPEISIIALKPGVAAIGERDSSADDADGRR